MFFISVFNNNNKNIHKNKTNTTEDYNLKIWINIVIFHRFIIILVTTRERFIVVKMTFNLKQTNETPFTYDTHVMYFYLNNICI